MAVLVSGGVYFVFRCCNHEETKQMAVEKMEESWNKTKDTGDEAVQKIKDLAK